MIFNIFIEKKNIVIEWNNKKEVEEYLNKISLILLSIDDDYLNKKLSCLFDNLKLDNLPEIGDIFILVKDKKIFYYKIIRYLLANIETARDPLDLYIEVLLIEVFNNDSDYVDIQKTYISVTSFMEKINNFTKYDKLPKKLIESIIKLLN